MIRRFSLMILFLAPAAVFASSRSNPSANFVSVPIVMSLPSSVTTIEESVVRFGTNRLRDGFEIDQSLGDVSINDPFVIRLSGVKVKGKLNGRLERDAKGIIVETMLTNLQVSVDRISIHSTVAVEVSGVDARIRIDAECTQSKISWADHSLPVFARAKPVLRPVLSADFSGLTLPSSLPKPDMTLSCQGPFGIDGMIRDYAWTAIQKRWAEESFARELETKLEAAVTDGLRIGGSGLTLVKQPYLTAVLKPQGYELGLQATHLRAQIELQMDRPIPITIKNQRAADLPSAGIDQITISMTATMAETLTQAWFSPGVWSEWIDAQSVEGFRKLMSSRFKQFIAFPDLMNYDKGAAFWFAFDMKAPPTLNCSSNGVDIGVSLGTWLLLKDFQNPSLAMGYRPLVYFSIPTVLSVSPPQVRNAQKMTAGLQSLGLSSEFDARYMREENPNPNIATDLMVGDVEDFVREKTGDLTKLEGGLGEAVRWLDQTNLSCESATQMLRLSF